MTMRGHLLWIVAALAHAGCVTAPPRPFTVEVRALTDEDQPLGGVVVALDGKAVGTTDDSGRLRLARHEQEGTRIGVTVATPRGYRLVDEMQPLVLRRLSRVTEGVARELPIEYVVRLAPLQRQYAVLVDVGVPDLSVEAFGARRAVTNSHGVASFLYTGSPGDELAVQVTSEGHDELKPKVVNSNFVLASHSEAYLVQGSFEARPPAPPAPHHVHERVRVIKPRRL
jgi:hypothetical protein